MPKKKEMSMKEALELVYGLALDNVAPPDRELMKERKKQMEALEKVRNLSNGESGWINPFECPQCHTAGTDVDSEVVGARYWPDSVDWTENNMLEVGLWCFKCYRTWKTIFVPTIVKDVELDHEFRREMKEEG